MFIWFGLLLLKKKVEMTGGQIIIVYCQNTTGLMGLCNHIEGMFYRMEAAILQGLITHPSCTSILAKSNIPKLKTKAEGVKLKEPVFTKPNCKKKATHDQEKPCRAKRDFLAWGPQMFQFKIKL